jgi:hypothetical protein
MQWQKILSYKQKHENFLPLAFMKDGAVALTHTHPSAYPNLHLNNTR